MSHAVIRRRWKWALWAAALAGGSYATYRVYKSESVQRRLQKLVRLFNALLLIGDAAQISAETVSLISSDLKRFLLSDDDDIPRSLRQLLKIAHSPEFERSSTLLVAATTRGIIRGVVTPRSPPYRRSFTADDPPCTEIKEICLVSCAEPLGFQKGRVQNREKNDRHAFVDPVIGTSIYLDKAKHQSESKPSKELLDRCFDKLFSKSGINFASAVLSTAARDIVKAIFEGFENQNRAANVAFREENNASYKILDVLCTPQGKSLITECIQTLVNTSVAVYVERTKDINFYEDMVAGITNPSYKDPMKDLLSSMCNGAIETFIRTSHSVMFAEASRQRSYEMECRENANNYTIEQLSDGSHVQRQMSSGSSASSISAIAPCHGPTVDNISCFNSSIEMDPVQGWRGKPEKFQREGAGIQNMIDGISRTLAVPSNHKLVVDVAGTMTSQAVRTFVDVMISTISSNVQSKMRSGWGRLKSTFGQNTVIKAQAVHRDLAMKAFFLASICLAICLHLLTALHIEIN
ncbi:hypothetical protein KP509_30G004000 [Ceratopteris richardii]|uniref:Protein PHLOEM PROTEIN 2-LIKE A10 n=1 Tax=Ceratopteris richardii TaxID=49495 RepID=A0A8T2QZN6_CERRI|nr:hypothetical protein KP509_30G004000 [Ceratopteris richardii]